MRNNDLEQIFELQEKAIDYKHATQKAIMHKMLKQQKVSPNTYQRKKQSLEIWVDNEKQRINQHKKELQNVFQNTIDIIQNTNKNKERIKKILDRSQTKRPGIWSDYGESLNSIDTSRSKNNVSMNINKLKGLVNGSNEQSINSLIFSGDKIKINNDSIESHNSGLHDIKQSLKNKLLKYSKKYNEAHKEVEYEPNKQLYLTPTTQNVKIEIVSNQKSRSP